MNSLWTVKSLNKGLASHQFVYHCKQQLFSFLSMSFVLLLMFNNSQEQAKYNISTQFQLRKMWGSISLAAGVGYLTVVGQREKNATSPHYFTPCNSAYQGHHSGWYSFELPAFCEESANHRPGMQKSMVICCIFLIFC